MPQTAGVTTAPDEPTASTAETTSSDVATGRRRAGMVAIWVAGTVTATVLATLAVQVAGAKVTQRPAATVSRSQIETEVARQRSVSTPPAESGAGSAGSSVAGPATDPEAPAGAGDDAAGGVSGARPPSSLGTPSPVPTPSTPTPTPAPVPGRSSTTVAATPAPRSPVTSTGPTAPAPTVTPTSTAPVTTAPVSEQTFVLTGGSVRVRCTGSAGQRLSSSPVPGFAMEIRSSGPQEVDVRFESAAHRSELKATCSATGAIVAEPREEDHGGGGADGGSLGA